MRWLKRFAELIVGLIVLFVFLNTFVDPESFGPLGPCGNTPQSWVAVYFFIALNPPAWITYSPFIIMSWFIGWVIFRLAEKPVSRLVEDGGKSRSSRYKGD